MCACLPASVLLQLTRKRCARDKAVALKLQIRRADMTRRYVRRVTLVWPAEAAPNRSLDVRVQYVWKRMSYVTPQQEKVRRVEFCAEGGEVLRGGKGRWRFDPRRRRMERGWRVIVEGPRAC